MSSTLNVPEPVNYNINKVDDTDTVLARVN